VLGCDVFVAEPLGDGISKKHLSTEFVRSGFIAKLDKNIYQGERLFVTIATIIMIFSVFFGIVWNFFSTPKGKMYSLVEAIAGEEANVAFISGTITITLWLVACIFAVKTAKTDWAASKHLIFGLGIGALFLAFGKLMVIMLPSGLIFAQRLALCLMLWVVMLGSSMAAYTRRHIVLQAIRKLIPDHMQRQHAAVGLGVASVFTLFLALVGWDYAVINFEQWVNADMKAGKFESIPIPYWAITIAIPVGFGLTLARFVGHAIFILKGVMEPVPTEEELKAARGEIGADADFDEFSRLVEEEETEKNQLESLAWTAATGVSKKDE
jgi:TRAP-type C4-dicarboxylate transport system permease small subunit